jgi:2-polyprenyl-6-methoxyphenol hydroxylase-like FAD-dependent oxidoreductase
MKRALVIGGGISGLTVAHALADTGMQVDLYERSPEITEVGAGITLWANALFALQYLDLLEPVQAAGQIVRSFAFLSSYGALLGTIDLHRLEEKMGVYSLSIHRHNLVEALALALDDKFEGAVRVHTGADFVSYSEDKSGVTAYFRDGSTECGDFLIACDGFNSRVRKMLATSYENEANYAGYSCYRGVVTLPPASFTTGCVHHFACAGSQFGYLHVDSSRLAFYATVNCAAGIIEAPVHRKQFLIERFSGCSPVVENLVNGVAADEILRHDIYDRPALERWYRPRVLLAGDAAHPTTPNLGQGACLALEDAAVLRFCFKQSENVELAFALFERLRKERCRYVVRSSRRAGKFSQNEQPLAMKLRDQIFAMSMKGGRSLAMDKIICYKVPV